MLLGNSKVAAAMVGRAVENQQDVLPRKLARQHLKEDLKHSVFEVGMIKYTQVPSLGETAPYK